MTVADQIRTKPGLQSDSRFIMFHSGKTGPWAIILAAGSGSRAAEGLRDRPKQFVQYKNLPLYWHSVLAMRASGLIDGLVFVFPRQHFNWAYAQLEVLSKDASLQIPWQAVVGGDTRQKSVFAGLSAIPEFVRHVLVHDAARPFVKPGLIAALCKALEEGATAVLPGIPLRDTIKICKNGTAKIVDKTPDRELLVAAQTPQAFDVRKLRDAHRLAISKNMFNATDDAMLLEMAGEEVAVVSGDPENKKITYSNELIELLRMKHTKIPCSGFGYDVHAFGQGRPLKLGGVEISCPFGILAHSDGDVLLHALMDAILGCACLGDIGQIFPDTDSSYENISSAMLLRQVLDLAANAGVTLNQVDLTIVTQTPRISPYKEAIRQNIASMLNLPCARVNLKATTEENLGFTGAQLGIKAYALVSGWRDCSEDPAEK